MFEAPKLTNAGKALYYRNLGGATLEITKMKIGDGQLATPIATLTDLVNTVVTIDAAVKQHSDYAEATASFSNAGLSTGFYWREIGIFCADPDNSEDRSKDILYCYQNAYDTADYIAPAATELVEKSITIPIIVGDADNVTCTLDKSLIFATLKDLEDHEADPSYLKNSVLGVPGGIATLNADGRLTESQRWEVDSYKKAETDQLISGAVDTHNSAENAHSDIRASIAAMNAGIKALELKFGTNITKNPFSATFGSLDGLTVTGVWNAEQARVEF